MNRKYVLPDLDYDYGALEPHIIGPIMELHHGKHHAAYVKNANEAAVRLEEATVTEDYTPLAALERSLAFNLSGHILHSIFWKNLEPKGGGKPDGDLGRAIERDFGSFEHFRGRMVAVASGIMGSGWAALTWEPLSERLLITQIYDHQSNLNQAGVPLMVIDAWEHALDRAEALRMPHEALLAHQVLGASGSASGRRQATHSRRASELAAEMGIELPSLPVGWP